MKSWIEECWILLTVIAAGLTVSLLLGFKLWGLVVVLIAYAVWGIHRLHVLKSWLEKGAETALTPDTNGLLDTIVQLVHRSKRSERRHRGMLQRTIREFNTLASELPDATVVLDERWQIRWCNATAETLFGLSLSRDDGSRIDNLIRAPEFTAFLESAKTDRAELEFPSPVSVRTTLLMTCLPASESQFLLIGRDITEQAQLREMRKAFVADVSHELRTPLTVIQGHVEMMLNDDTDDINQSNQLALKRINEQSGRMKTIVEDLLTLSRLESYKLTSEEGEWVNLGSLVRGLINDLSMRSPDSHHVFNLLLDENLVVKGIEQELHSCCQNLIQNAIAYTPDGTQIDIEWRRAQAQEQYPQPAGQPDAKNTATNEWRPTNLAEPVSETLAAWLIVRDYGPGIEKEHLPRLSERFYRADKARSRSTGGTGLGLAIVKHIAQRHGGQLLIASQLGTGSQFTVGIPQGRINSADSAAPPADEIKGFGASNDLHSTDQLKAAEERPTTPETPTDSDKYSPSS